jgi:hypothetical protein
MLATIALTLLAIGRVAVPPSSATAECYHSYDSTGNYNHVTAGIQDPENPGDYIYWTCDDFSKVEWQENGYKLSTSTISGSNDVTLSGAMIFFRIKGTETTPPAISVPLEANVFGNTHMSGHSSSAYVHGTGYSLNATGNCGGPSGMYTIPDDWDWQGTALLTDIDGIPAWEARIFTQATVFVSIG